MDELRKIDLNLLLTLHALLTEQHVTRAAERLHRSQPAVSHALSLLRAHFDDPLLIRRNGKMLLSTKAQTLLPLLESSLHGLNSLLATPVFDAGSVNRRVRIAMSDYAAQTILPPLMQFLRQEAPGIDLVISQAGHDMMLAQLSEGVIDLAMGIFPGEQIGVKKSELFPEQFICLADRQFLPEDRELTLEEWLDRPHVMLGQLPDAMDEAEKMLIRKGLKRHICLSLPHWSAAVSLLPGTDLILTVASRAISPELYHESLCRFTPPIPLADFAYEMAWHVRKDNDPVLQWLRGAIIDSCETFREKDTFARASL